MTDQPVTTEYGRFDADGTIYVRTAAGEVSVGQYTIGTPEEGLAFFIRKFEDLQAEIALAKQRLSEGKASADGITQLVARLKAELETPKMVGDLQLLAQAVVDLEVVSAEKAAERQAQRAAQKAQVLEKREAIVAEAESLGASTQWKATGERFKTLLDEWKALPHADRASEQALWKRFSTARTQFDKTRRTHFAQRDAATAESKSIRSAIVAEAEALANSTDWIAARQSFQTLMDRWKAAPRGNRKDDDALWARFRDAQQKFYDARNADLAVRDEALKGNLDAKLVLLAEAEALLPITDMAATKKALRSIAERWEAIGHVPRAEKERVEGRLRRVEQALRDLEQEEWRRSDPARKAFASDTASTFRAGVDKAEKELEAANAKGDAKAIANAQARLNSAKMLLEAAEKYA
mgnify:CR=1 FL=1